MINIIMNKFSYKVDKQLIKYIKEVACNDVNSYFNQLPKELINIITEFTMVYYPVMTNFRKLIELVFTNDIRYYHLILDDPDEENINNRIIFISFRNMFYRRVKIKQYSANMGFSNNSLMEKIFNSLLSSKSKHDYYIYNKILIKSIQPLFFESQNDIYEYAKMINV
jgi:hypothetical protein